MDILSNSFPVRFGAYARALAIWLSDSSDMTFMFAPINEASYLAWAGGDIAMMNPFQMARGVELKAQLIRACIEGMEAIRGVFPAARFVHPEPIISIVADRTRPKTWKRVECDNLLQFQAWDMLTGRVWPSLGGHPRYLDIIGVNYYPNNQFTLDGGVISVGDEQYTPFSHLLAQVSRRYGRPIVITETGSEGEDRVPWFRYMVEQTITAMRCDVEIHAVTLYPIVNHPGWVDDRHCHNGLWDYAQPDGSREAYTPLEADIPLQASRLASERTAMLARRSSAARLHGLSTGTSDVAITIT